MNKAVTNLKPESEVSLDPLAKLREPFGPNHISKLPKETGAQAKQRKADQDAGKWPAKCPVCEGYHHPKAVHLDYVGHAALTDRLLDTDPLWTWEPMGFAADGTPAFDRNGGLWIKLTVCGVTRLGYGSADGKSGGDAVKEIIGDALRNAAMRFGAALDLWHKGDLHAEETEPTLTMEQQAMNLLRGASADKGLFKEAWERNKAGWRAAMAPEAYARVIAEMKRIAMNFPPEQTASAPEPEPEAAPQTEANGFGIPDDEIPF